MPATCRFLEDDAIVESTYSGEATPAEQQENILRATATAREQASYRFLTDLSALHHGPGPAELLGAIERFEALGLPRSLREALILPPGSLTLTDVKFYEDACQNRGWNVRIFSDRASALSWLRSA